MFDPSIRENQVYGDFPLHFDPIKQESLPGATRGEKIPLDTGMKILENGDVSFAVYAPNSGTVSVSSAKRQLELTKGEDGIFRGILPYDEDFLGPHSLDFFIDGVCFLNPYVPISWHRNRPVNYIDLPDPATPYIQVRDVPHGAVTREIFWSETLGRYERCLIYTPPGYMNGTDYYPVLYLQHGATENEVTWEYNGRVSAIMDNLIAEGKCVPFIVVMNNGMLRYPGNEKMDDAFENLLIHDCIPYIEKTYRVKTDKWNRAMAGLSMGSMQTSKTGLNHPELFAYLGVFSGFMRYGDGGTEREKEHLKAIYNTEKFAADYKVFFRSVGDKDMVQRSFYEDDEYCKESGIDRLPNYHRVIYPGQYHEFGAWRRALYDFSQLIFK